PLLVEADPNQLQQALVNLALNARDALRERGERSGAGLGADVLPSPAQSVTFRLRRRVLGGEWPAFPQNVPAGDYVVLEVADQGCGMTEAVLGQALDPFFTTKEVGQGTGLGLPRVFGIIQGPQGSLAIDSAPDRGTCASLYLPRHATAAEDEARMSFESGQVLEPESIPGR